VFSAFSPVFNCRVVLRLAKPTGISVGVEGSYDALQPIVESYGADAGTMDLLCLIRLSFSAIWRLTDAADNWCLSRSADRVRRDLLVRYRPIRQWRSAHGASAEILNFPRLS
jgi:hypothetical protein